MDRFRAGALDVLVATTVIEVGVDVPDATVMVIEDAHRFGIAQLHQLRGRVGRSTLASWCYLLGEPTTADGAARLEAARRARTTASSSPRSTSSCAARGRSSARASRAAATCGSRKLSPGPRRRSASRGRSPRSCSTRTPSSPGTPSCARSSRVFLDDDEAAWLFKS